MAYNKSFTYILMHINPNYISKYEKKKQNPHMMICHQI